MDRNSFIEHARHERTHWWFQSRHGIVERLILRLLGSTQSTPRVVEIGCGTGELMHRLSSKMSTFGADISASAIEIARANYPQVRFTSYEKTAELAPEISAADVILLLDVLEHVQDDFELFSEISSLMKPGAVLLLTVPADPRLWSTHDEAMYHFRRYTPERLAMLWQGLSLTPRLLSGLNWRLAPPIRLIRKLGELRKPSSPSAQESAVKTDLGALPGWINATLRQIFISEATALEKLIDHCDARPTPHQSGISLIAALTRNPGELVVRTKPASCPADEHVPKPFD